MKLVVGADIHNHRWPEHDFVDKKLGYSRRLEDCAAVIDEMTVTALAEGAQTIVIPGDLYEVAPAIPQTYVRHTDPPLPSLGGAYDRAANAGWPTHHIATGHDLMLPDPVGTAALLRTIDGAVG